MACGGATQDLEQHIPALRQALADYLCLGHFHLYAWLLRRRPCLPQNTLARARTSYQRIRRCTGRAVEFHDKYDTDPAGLADEPALCGDLFRLTGALRQHFAAEEELIRLLCGNNQWGQA